MCLFPTSAAGTIAYDKGVKQFNCGACPECLKTRAGAWALRAVYEAREHCHSLMCTLTYDQYLRDSRGRIIGEQVADRRVDVADCQKFIKRVRKYFDKQGIKIKYIIAAEYGKRTHRPHYHVLLFGAWFDDIRFYKKSKRGNPIFRSKTLEKLWPHGICTVDKKDVNAAAARYCTKYLSKDKDASDTFQLFSQCLGLAGLLRDFNGLYYMVEGRKYPVPRIVWQHVLREKYPDLHLDFRYVNKPKEFPNTEEYYVNMEKYNAAKERRDFAVQVRDNDAQYKQYREYWSARVEEYEVGQLPVIDRIALLPDSKYFFYKQRALRCFSLRKRCIPYPAPRTRQRMAMFKYMMSKPWVYGDISKYENYDFDTCRCASRLATASDTSSAPPLYLMFDAEYLQARVQAIYDSAVQAAAYDTEIFSAVS